MDSQQKKLLQLLGKTEEENEPDLSSLLPLLRQALKNNEDSKYQTVEDHKQSLLDSFKKLSEKETFEVGDIVTWKEGLKNKGRPKYNEPVIVVSILEEHVFDKENQAGSPYFREPLDIILGTYDSDGDFALYHYDSRRFRQF
jgi:hypothetical protein